jgi:hypothetical protein
MKKVVLVICMLSMGSVCWAQVTTPSLGTAASFAVLGRTNVTCTAPGVITGDVGVSPGTFTNTTGCTIAGTVNVNDLAAMNAQAAFLNAYAALKDNLLTPCTQTISTAAFTGNVPVLGPLPPGVYSPETRAPRLLCGRLNLDDLESKLGGFGLEMFDL